MAIPYSAVFECRPNGYDYNGGGFNSLAPSGIDYSQQDEAQVVFDNITNTLTVHTTTTMVNISGSYNVSGFDIGNCVYPSGGGMTPGRYFITAADSGNKRWTLDRAAGTAGQRGMGRMGGANKLPGSITNVGGTTLVAGNQIWIKKGTYRPLTATAGPSGTVNTSVAIKMEGYDTVRGDNGVPTFDGRLPGIYTMFVNAAGVATILRNLMVVQQSGTMTGFSGSSGNSNGLIENCVASGCTAGFAQARTQNCLAIECGGGFDSCEVEYCGALRCTTYGMSQTDRFASNSWSAYASGDGFSCLNGGGAYNCTSYRSAGDGFEMSTTTLAVLTNCVAVHSSGYGFKVNTTNGPGCVLIRCADYGSILGPIVSSTSPSGLLQQVVSMSGDPFINGPALDFRANNLTNAGTLIKGSGITPYGQVSYRDIGAVQHYDGLIGTTMKGFMR